MSTAAISNGKGKPNGHGGQVTAFLTDSTLCIGCKACEVACKEWNQLSEDGYEWSGHSYDNTQAVGHSTWRHVKFVENPTTIGAGGNDAGQLPGWGFSSDVCKHCEEAGCLEACPTGAIVRMDFGAVFVQPDICNGCAYCVVSCPFGVVEKNREDGRAFKCTFCSDRQQAGLKPACAQACPTESIKFGEINQLHAEAEERLKLLQARGVDDAVIYDPVDTSVKGIHAFFLLRGDPRSYNLPPQPEVPTIYLKKGWTSAAVAAGAMLGATLLAFLGDNRR
ncbi:MAG TPA: 4Fe-4S dicluster domain-containing protein [Candidatus Limnocylindrales bacterium]|nr:4Fe-4S dicluster domain-containing protein [Candidatus Limnocylindrales bacterium]